MCPFTTNVYCTAGVTVFKQRMAVCSAGRVQHWPCAALAVCSAGAGACFRFTQASIYQSLCCFIISNGDFSSFRLFSFSIRHHCSGPISLWFRLRRQLGPTLATLLVNTVIAITLKPGKYP